MKLYVVETATNKAERYANWLKDKFTLTRKWTDADIVMFTGGADVSPLLYHEIPHKMTVTSPSRDAKEIRFFMSALHTGKKMIGICRGAQFLTVMAGGKLIQHVTNHAITTNHSIKALGCTTPVMMSSTHHQMMNPYCLPDTDYKLLAWTEKLSDKYEGEQNKSLRMSPDFKEPEIVYYPKIKGLAIQGHPEQLSTYAQGVHYCKSLVSKLTKDEL